MNSELKVGDVVALAELGCHLIMDNAWYPYAVVVQISPLVLVSREADARWTNLSADQLKVIGTCDGIDLEFCMTRIKE